MLADIIILMKSFFLALILGLVLLRAFGSVIVIVFVNSTSLLVLLGSKLCCIHHHFYSMELFLVLSSHMAHSEGTHP